MGICKLIRLFMIVLFIYTYLCMYLPQAVALPSSLGIEWDLFGRIHLAQEGEIEPAVVTSSVAVPISPATPLQSTQVFRPTT